MTNAVVIETPDVLVRTLVHLDARGHCPDLWAPAELTAAIKAYLG